MYATQVLATFALASLFLVALTAADETSTTAAPDVNPGLVKVMDLTKVRIIFVTAFLFLMTTSAGTLSEESARAARDPKSPLLSDDYSTDSKRPFLEKRARAPTDAKGPLLSDDYSIQTVIQDAINNMIDVVVDFISRHL
ncbi:hypothetical protein HNY73_013907 [Argiope bruennichi]|uniref:RxLR effector protein n=1 Tax=Argiope bruennichi TaxID=94029 RepID=A0A8T0ER97_ARGBR|nr:hypothetical protein HNY73_013907 [Argiope bruennichi]